ncbi:MAG TPA: kelch repeat-containing protein [Candidatus Binataceae bacterium]|nr:kelch repeat-containing protein [Candidatus Binataceae bacterium]
MASPVLVGARFTISGSGFTSGTVVNFFVSTSLGGINEGPLTPASVDSTLLTVEIPANVPLGQGVVALQVVNTDQGFTTSNMRTALLEGAASAGIPSLTAINGVALAATSAAPGYATDNVETVVPQGSEVTLQGNGFDTANGVAVDVFCACARGKVGPFFINPGDPGLSATSITVALPATGPNALPVGPASFRVSNKGADGHYTRYSNAVSAPVGRRIQVMSVTQEGTTLIVDGTGFSTMTVLNFYATQKGAIANLGGFTPSGAAAIAITLVSDTELRFAVPAGAAPGPAYVQAINPPFVPFSSTGNDPNGAFILVDTSASPTPAATPSATATAIGTATATPRSATPTPKSSGLPTATPTKSAAADGMLMTGGLDNTVTSSGSHPTLASAETYDETTNAFTSTGPMGYPRLGHSVTVLNNQTILIAGGHNAFSARSMPSAELYDIKTGSFSFTGSMNSARLNHAAVLLNNGKVLISGGQNPDFSAIDLAEVYDPATGQFSPTASMLNARLGHTATVLKDGTVLIAGGADNDGLLKSAELYDAKGAGSAPVGSMTAVRQGATATLLPNGSVLIAGGASQVGSCAGCATASAEIYNPSTKTFTRSGNMGTPRRGHSATLLSNGTVLIAGGLNDASGAVLATTEIYNPATRTFSRAASMNVARFDHVAGALASGKVLLAGGFNSPSAITNTAELYDPATGKFTPAGGMTDSRADQGMGCFSLTGSDSWAHAPR